MVQGERVNIYIDGGNFHHLVLKKMRIDELNFDFDGFTKYLVNGRIVPPMAKRYYVGTVREEEDNERSREAMAKQTKFFTVLNSYGWELKTSKLRKRMEKIVIDRRVLNYEELLGKGIKQIEFERVREKGIDVKIATDLIAGGIDDQYDAAIVVSSDADLVPAIDWVRNRLKKKIEYVGFSLIDPVNSLNNTRPLQTFFSRTDIQRILVESDLKQFCRPFVQKA